MQLSLQQSSCIEFIRNGKGAAALLMKSLTCAVLTSTRPCCTLMAEASPLTRLRALFFSQAESAAQVAVASAAADQTAQAGVIWLAGSRLRAPSPCLHPSAAPPDASGPVHNQNVM